MQQPLNGAALRVRERIDATTAIAYIGVIRPPRRPPGCAKRPSATARSTSPLTATGRDASATRSPTQAVDGAELLDLLGAAGRPAAKPDHARA